MAEIDKFRIILIGKTGNGKSRTGNSILGSNVFEFSAQSQSVTKSCKLSETSRFGKQICVVDTPGLFDTRTENAAVQEEIKKCISLTTPGPHAIILCVQFGRFTKEDTDAVDFFVKHFGESMMKYVIVLFTRFDDWKRENSDKNGQCSNLNGYINTFSDNRLKSFLQRSSNRYIPFDNTLKGYDAENQVKDLITKIKEMVKQNGGSHYTNNDYQLTEKRRIEENERVKLQKERDRRLREENIRKREEERLRKEYDEKERQLHEELARVRQEQDSAALAAATAIVTMRPMTMMPCSLQ